MENTLNKKYRHQSNPLEKKLHDGFIKLLDSNDGVLTASQMIFPTIDGIHPVEMLSDREEQIVVNTIQWLGSPVGQTFLREHGFKIPKDEV